MGNERDPFFLAELWRLDWWDRIGKPVLSHGARKRARTSTSAFHRPRLAPAEGFEPPGDIAFVALHLYIQGAYPLAFGAVFNAAVAV
jgi:hypothetical protein